MTFLPIVERELRVATRTRFTYWLRVVAAAVALIFGGGYFLLMTVTPFAGAGFTLGGPLFAILTWMCFAATLSAGLFFTSDCLSEEKREGTLGFLFLTDLRGYDVVLGKLFVTSLRCAFALLAVFPILAVTLLLGGVEPAQFWKAMLALLNAMFFSLATGMFVSSLSRDGQKALAATLVLLAGWTFLGPALDSMMAAINGRPERSVFGLSSPARAFQSANDWRGGFWRALVSPVSINSSKLENAMRWGLRRIRYGISNNGSAKRPNRAVGVKNSMAI
jgi:ABC-type transport system involved in multi-copper enzyme maturation permease subunit